MWVSFPTIVNTWINTTEVNLWVKTLITSDCEYVVHCSIELEVLNPTIEVVECVTYSKALETDIVTLLDELVRWDIRTCI